MSEAAISFGNIAKKTTETTGSPLMSGEPWFKSPREEVGLTFWAGGLFGRDLTVDRDFCDRIAERWDLKDKGLSLSFGGLLSQEFWLATDQCERK